MSRWLEDPDVHGSLAQRLGVTTEPLSRSCFNCPAGEVDGYCRDNGCALTTQETAPAAPTTCCLPVLVRPCMPRDTFYGFAGPTPPPCYQCTTPDACSTPIDLANQETPAVPDTNPKAARAVADGKLRLELVETALTHPLARVMAHGADKYGVRNWRTQPIEARTYVGAMRRHIDAWADGQDADPDSGANHLVHLAACCMVVLDAAAHGTLTDNRDYAEAKPPVKLTAEYSAGQDDVVEELRAAASLVPSMRPGDCQDACAPPSSECPLGGLCVVSGGCAAPCKPWPKP